MQTLPNMLRYQEVCDRLSVSKATIQRWIADTEKPFPAPRYIKRTAFFREDEIAQWLDKSSCRHHGASVNFHHTQ